MRDYGVIHNGFWSNGDLRKMGDDARFLAAYLLTSPHTNTLGAFRLPDAYACEDLGWSSERFQNGLTTLSRIGFVKYDANAKFVWVVKFLTWNRPANPNIWKAIVKAAKAVPEAVAFKDEILSAAGVSETVSEPLGNTPSPSPSQSPSLVPEQGEESEFRFPLANGSEHVVSLAEVAEFEQAYPRIDVSGELRKARAWSIANPAQRKTPRGIGKFVNGWLSRASERSSANGSSVAYLPGGGRRAL